MSIPQYLLNSFDKIFIHRKSLNSQVAQRILQNFDSSLIEIVDTEPMQDVRGKLTSQQFNKSKRTLYVCEFEGDFFKRCPGSVQKKALNCCNYYVLNLGYQCNMNCSYCYLQSYVNSPMMKIYSNIDKAIGELEAMASDFPNHPFRVGTGEVIDSLSLDEITLYSRELIAFFKKYPKWVLEFKTKSNRVDQFLDLEHAGNIVVSWSINAPAVIEHEEHGTASLDERLSAAKKCVEAGYMVAFHIDPLIWHPSWQDGYQQLVNRLTTEFNPKDVQVVSVGALRFQPEQRHMMRERFGMDSWVTQAEMFHGEGAKLRYDHRLRNQMFDHVLSEFKKFPEWKVFLCMETPESWIQHYDSTPAQDSKLKDFFRPLPKKQSTTLQLPREDSR